MPRLENETKNVSPLFVHKKHVSYHYDYRLLRCDTM